MFLGPMFCLFGINVAAHVLPSGAAVWRIHCANRRSNCFDFMRPVLANLVRSLRQRLAFQDHLSASSTRDPLGAVTLARHPPVRRK